MYQARNETGRRSKGLDSINFVPTYRYQKYKFSQLHTPAGDRDRPRYPNTLLLLFSCLVRACSMCFTLTHQREWFLIRLMHMIHLRINPSLVCTERD